MQAQVRHSPLAEQPKTYTTIASSEFVAEAAESCRQRGLNLTPIRRRVLEVVAASTVPVPAYAIVYQLSDTKLVAPPTIYRALEFLIEAGFVRHLALCRAYICCTQPVGGPLVAVLMCTTCGVVSESVSEPIRQTVADLAETTGFEPRSRTIEIEGQCAACRGGNQN
jgi:Fur family transcriptional regulator, zinc uptake regulator